MLFIQHGLISTCNSKWPLMNLIWGFVCEAGDWNINLELGIIVVSASIWARSPESSPGVLHPSSHTDSSPTRLCFRDRHLGDGCTQRCCECRGTHRAPAWFDILSRSVDSGTFLPRQHARSADPSGRSALGSSLLDLNLRGAGFPAVRYWEKREPRHALIWLSHRQSIDNVSGVSSVVISSRTVPAARDHRHFRVLLRLTTPVHLFCRALLDCSCTDRHKFGWVFLSLLGSKRLFELVCSLPNTLKSCETSLSSRIPLFSKALVPGKPCPPEVIITDLRSWLVKLLNSIGYCSQTGNLKSQLHGQSDQKGCWRGRKRSRGRMCRVGQWELKAVRPGTGPTLLPLICALKNVAKCFLSVSVISWYAGKWPRCLILSCPIRRPGSLRYCQINITVKCELGHSFCCFERNGTGSRIASYSWNPERYTIPSLSGFLNRWQPWYAADVTHYSGKHKTI